MEDDSQDKLDDQLMALIGQEIEILDNYMLSLAHATTQKPPEKNVPNLNLLPTLSPGYFALMMLSAVAVICLTLYLCITHRPQPKTQGFQHLPTENMTSPAKLPMHQVPIGPDDSLKDMNVQRSDNERASFLPQKVELEHFSSPEPNSNSSDNSTPHSFNRSVSSMSIQVELDDSDAISYQSGLGCQNIGSVDDEVSSILTRAIESRQESISSTRSPTRQSKSVKTIVSLKSEQSHFPTNKSTKSKSVDNDLSSATGERIRLVLMDDASGGEIGEADEKFMDLFRSDSNAKRMDELQSKREKYLASINRTNK